MADKMVLDLRDVAQTVMTNEYARLVRKNCAMIVREECCAGCHDGVCETCNVGRALKRLEGRA